MARLGKRIRTNHLEVRAVASPLRHARVGIIVPKHRHSSVDRNRLKRRLRELARTQLLPQLPALDVVIRARESAYDAPFAALAEEVASVERRLSGGGAAK